MLRIFGDEQRAQPAKNLRRQMSTFQEVAVPQYHSALRNVTTDARDPRRLVAAPATIVAARTPSRNFWQQKYFHANPGNCHSVPVKLRFLRILKSDSQNQSSYRHLITV